MIDPRYEDGGKPTISQFRLAWQLKCWGYSQKGGSPTMLYQMFDGAPPPDEYSPRQGLALGQLVCTQQREVEFTPDGPVPTGRTPWGYGWRD
jgi:hypothetical protein